MGLVLVGPFGEQATPDGRFGLCNNEWNTSDNPN